MVSEIFRNAFTVFSKSFRYIALISFFVHVPRYAIILSIPDAWRPSINVLLQMDIQEMFAAMLPIQAVMYVIWVVFDPLLVAGFVYVAMRTLAEKNFIPWLLWTKVSGEFPRLSKAIGL